MYCDVASDRLHDIRDIGPRTNTDSCRGSPALSAPQFKVGGRIMLSVLVLEPNFLCLRCLTAGSTQLNLALVQPALIGRSVVNIIGCSHLMVECQLFPESIVGFA